MLRLSPPRPARVTNAALALGLLALLPVSAAAQVMTDPDLQVTALFPNGSLSQPTTMAFLGPNDFLVLEKATGRVRRVLGGVIQPTPALDANVHSSSERGMLGIAVDPGSPPRAFLYYTEAPGPGDTSDSGTTPLGNRVYRYDWDSATGTLVNGQMILDLPVTPGPNHDGGVLLWDEAAGHLYAVIGDLNRNGQMQNNPGGAAADNTGGILRVDADGNPAAGNPFTPYCSVTTTQTCASNPDCPGGETCRTAVARYFAYGIRNCFGMAFDPSTGAVWMTENGPGDYDEVNRVDAGFNSGWNRIHGPDSRDPQDISDLFHMPGAGITYSDPEFSWLDTIAPTGILFPVGSSWGPGYDAMAVVGDNNFGQLYAFPLDAPRSGFAPGGGLNDLVADSAAERNLSRLGSGFGVVTHVVRGPEQPNPHVYVVSLTNGTIYRVTGPHADPLPSLAINDVAVAEGNAGTTTATFTVTRSPAYGGQSTVNYATANVTAMAGSDYVGTSGMLTFAPGETTKPINVTVNGDTLFEPNETFNVTLSGASQATIGDATGVGTITNDDIPQPARVFVSIAGADANDCANVMTPCRTLGAAIAQVAIDGEVIVTKSGSYAGATINKGVKITAAPGVVAFSGFPITVNSGGGTTVVLRGLTLKAVTPGAGTGLLIQSAGAVFVESCVIDGWEFGILQQGAAEAFVKDSSIRNNSTGLYATTGKTSLDNARLTNNGIGIGSDAAAISLRGSTLSGNSSAGVYAHSSSSVTVDKCQITNNGSGVTLPASSLSTLRLSRSVVSGNGVGLENLGGTLEVNSTNVIRGNTINTAGTITMVGQQ